MRNPNTSQDEWEDEEGRIWPVVKLTPYDRRRNELRELEAKRDAIQSKGDDLSTIDRQTLAALAPMIAQAQERFQREGTRAKQDLSRKHRAIDEHRAGEGRDDYNAKRRKVRHHPNADLSDMTPDQKAQYERDRRSDANWFKRQRDKSMNEAAITAAYAERLEVRRREREEAAQEEAEMAAIRDRAIV